MNSTRTATSRPGRRRSKQNFTLRRDAPWCHYHAMKMLLCPCLAMGFVLSLAGFLRAAETPLVRHGDDWRYRKGAREPLANWHSLPDAELDATWLTGPGGFGYGDGDDTPR